MKVSKRFLERAKGSFRKYQKLLESARARDVNESDTTVIISDFLAEVLGWDKYSEVTTEFCIRSTFCDLALKVDGRPAFLIEVKSVGTDLKDNHLRQAIDATPRMPELVGHSSRTESNGRRTGCGSRNRSTPTRCLRSTCWIRTRDR
jgi:hypothetical protein